MPAFPSSVLRPALLAVACLPALLYAGAPSPEQRSLPVTSEPHFLVIYRPAERFPSGSADDIAAALAASPTMAAHKQHLGEALARGVIALGGPIAHLGEAAGPAGGAIVYRGLDEAALQAFIAADPAIAQRLERAEVYRFVPALAPAP
ncbi:MAG: hypothetical protein GXC76_07850 [Rhodanobacteraceae bacterium]|jgi:uncharacterized protein YciI|nr:hypothetical protein [Rhodanobacteraceae bacterium]